jgi:hypothetical protein
MTSWYSDRSGELERIRADLKRREALIESERQNEARRQAEREAEAAAAAERERARYEAAVEPQRREARRAYWLANPQGSEYEFEETWRKVCPTPAEVEERRIEQTVAELQARVWHLPTPGGPPARTMRELGPDEEP